MKFLNQIGQLTCLTTQKIFSSAEIHAQIKLRLNSFQSLGLKKKDRVLIRYGNTAGFFIDLFALWSMGACAVPIDPTNPISEVNDLAAHCQANYEIQTHNSDIICISNKLFFNEDEAQLILYTSGTAAHPKAVLHSLERIENKLKALKQNLNIEDFQRTLCILPTHFGHGLIGNCLFPLLSGCHLFIGKPFDSLSAELVVDVIDKNNITFMSSVPSFWPFFKNVQHPQKKSLERLHCASAMFSVELYSQIKAWAPQAKIYNVYGLTEFASWVSGLEIKSDLESNYLGKGWGAEFKIENSDDQGRGQVWIKSESIMLGYFKISNVVQAKEEWFYTGDIGIWDSELGLQIVGRSDDVINKGGFKIYPSEIEAVISKNKSVEKICVFSKITDENDQNVIAAYVSRDSNLTTAELESWSRNYLPAYRIPNKWFKLSEIPTTLRGKVNFKLLRELCVEELIQINSEFDVSFDSAIRKTFNLGLEADLAGLKYGAPSWDSIRHIDLFIQLQVLFKISFAADEIVNTSNYLDLKIITKKKYELK